MRYFSMFSGIGGFELGVNRAWEYLQEPGTGGTNSQLDGNKSMFLSGEAWRDSKYPLCIGYSEINKYAIQVYEKHFGGGCEISKEETERAREEDSEGLRIGENQGNDEGNKELGSSGTTAQQHSNRSPDRQFNRRGHKNYGDATRIIPEELPDFDLLVGGFPCQAFSIAGKRRGFEDTRGTLFFDIARILKVKRPKHFILENVKGLLSHDNGRTFKTIISTLVELGYGVEWQVLNSKNHGVPQNRERVFIVGYFGGEGCGKVFPIGESCGEVANLNYIGAIMSEKNKKWINDEKQLSRSFPQAQRVYSADGIGSTLAGNAGGLGGKTGLYAIPVLTPDRAEKRQNGRRMKDNGEPSFTLTSQDIHGIYDGMMIRRLTPTECERLQGFPDGWTDILSDSQRYKCLGNAVTVNVIEKIVGKLFFAEMKGKQ